MATALLNGLQGVLLTLLLENLGVGSATCSELDVDLRFRIEFVVTRHDFSHPYHVVGPNCEESARKLYNIESEPVVNWALPGTGADGPPADE